MSTWKKHLSAPSEGRLTLSAARRVKERTFRAMHDALRGGRLVTAEGILRANVAGMRNNLVWLEVTDPRIRRLVDEMSAEGEALLSEARKGAA